MPEINPYEPPQTRSRLLHESLPASEPEKSERPSLLAIVCAVILALIFIVRLYSI
jgi:hypothetical protein